MWEDEERRYERTIIAFVTGRHVRMGEQLLLQSLTHSPCFLSPSSFFSHTSLPPTLMRRKSRKKKTQLSVTDDSPVLSFSRQHLLTAAAASLCVFYRRENVLFFAATKRNSCNDRFRCRSMKALSSPSLLCAKAHNKCSSSCCSFISRGSKMVPATNSPGILCCMNSKGRHERRREERATASAAAASDDHVKQRFSLERSSSV